MKSVFLKTNKIGTSPWIFTGMVRKDRSIPNGEIVEIYDPEQRFIGYGLYHNHSQICLRVLHWGAKRTIDAAFFRGKIREALYLRHNTLSLPEIADCYRLFNSEGDGLPGLIVDRFGKHLVVELKSIGFYQIAEQICEVLRQEIRDSDCILRADKTTQEREGFKLTEKPSVATTWIQEHGIHFEVNFRTGHKTGFFCDQRDNRHYLAQLCKNKNVLDGCCYTGGFALYASILGHAGKVVGVDLDEKALAVAEKNSAKNQAQIEWVHADLFTYLRAQQQAKAHWDVVILDPPKFAANKDALPKAEKNYKDLNALAMSVIKNGGLLLTCSCSGLVATATFLALLKKAAARVNKRLQFLKIASAGPDHPYMPNFPESQYLKAVFCTVRDA